MGKLYGLVVQAARKAPKTEKYFYFRICWGRFKAFYSPERAPFYSTPAPQESFGTNFQKQMMQAVRENDVVIGTWHSPRLSRGSRAKFIGDNWRNDLIGGLLLAIKNNNRDRLFGKRILRDKCKILP
jgi:hypothetical protein